VLAEYIADSLPILFQVPFDCLPDVVIIAQPIALDHMQGFCVRRAEQVDHCIGVIGAHADGIDHQRVTLVVADGIPVPGRRHRRRMRLVQAHPANFVILTIQDRYLVRLLNHLHLYTLENKRHRFGPALVGRVRIGDAGERNFAEPLYELRRPGLQDRIGVVPDQLIIVAHPMPVLARRQSRRTAEG
jgi:hypothetical protein